MKIDILTIFPRMFDALNESLIGKAQTRELVDIQTVDFRDYADNKHNTVDDAPYGGGAGMLLQAQPILDAYEDIESKSNTKKRVILLDPAGKKFDQAMAKDFATAEELVFICGHYEGYDERVKTIVTDEVSIGDYVVTGGELAAMIMIDATMRFVPGVLGNDISAYDDSFSNDLLEFPQYTRPADYKGMKVPEVLTSGNHELIRQWRLRESLKKTYLKRPDLLENREFTNEEEKMLREIKADLL
ncbi:tRNA (guanine-N(1)-)-methyltransferase [Companilactobacillus sp. RD055328]|uniref:tRNA (guanosine(37)-N1)-methyltransferase TrmD n=1 Tax=Companilactobacillus sp. RD055328 TaxID=2916634 RepID=UPI001FC810C9|nr:tRNA (guanosine(37)-N1)-methyltransferase TrmD [Companilactobacillus sp. RD055328]GKQ42583.1 tRNA (guanine-N(1)-)-methyltransferase [Companilactobacillus sp. RD055328]